MLAYWQYVKKPGAARYLLVLFIFALGIMAKPMLVTLPFVLLLLDYWPLNRISNFNPQSEGLCEDTSRKGHCVLRCRQNIYRLIWEKIPFVILSVVAVVVAYYTQRDVGALSSFSALPLNYRILNALISYIKYIEKLFCPSHLAAFYPHPGLDVSILYAVVSVVVLLTVTILVFRFAKNHKYLITGWFWYLGTLVPVIGIIQIGGHAMADRYTYITLIGLFIIIAWGLPELLAKLISVSPQRKTALGVSMVIILTTLGICANRQTSYWKNSVTIFSHTIEVTQNNWLAHNNLGNAYTRLGRDNEAIDAYKQALNINPNLTEARTNLGIVYSKLGRDNEAIDAFKQALKIKPDYADAHYSLGISYAVLSRWSEAIDAFKQAIKINPEYADAHYNLGLAYSNLGRSTEAIDAYQQTIKINPNYAKAYNNLGAVYVNLNRYTEAIDTFKQAIRIKPDYEGAYLNLGVAYLAIGDKNSAMAEYNILKSLNSAMANNLLKEINK
jgi:Flp pilus assembly protein TadD